MGKRFPLGSTNERYNKILFSEQVSGTKTYKTKGWILFGTITACSTQMGKKLLVYLFLGHKLNCSLKAYN